MGCYNFKFENIFNKYFDVINDKELFLNIIFDLEDEFFIFENKIKNDLKDRFEKDYKYMEKILDKELDNIFKIYKTFKKNKEKEI